MKKAKFSTLVFCACIFATVHGQENKLLFKSGDRVCFIGNSITHDGGFHANIFLYYATRFPGRKISFFNCGVSGDVAWDISFRLRKDVLIHKPTVAVLMVGMNDMVRGVIEDTLAVNASKIQRMADTLLQYKKNVTRLADSLSANGCRLIFQLPSIYDETLKNGTGSLAGINEALGKCADFLRQLAVKYNATVVDYWTLMNKINEQHQKTDSAFTIVSNDRVHPGPPGHLVMAYQFLTTTGAPKYVAKIVLDAKAKKITGLVNCEAKIINASNIAVAFRVQERALPFPVSVESAPALALVSFTDNLNQELLQIKNLAAGNYSLFIDGKKAGNYTSSDFQQGVNLSADTLTPQYQQSLTVMKYCKEYHKIFDSLRTIAVVEYRSLRQYNGRDEITQKKIYLNERLEKIKEESYYEYVKQSCEQYYVLKPLESQLNNRLNSMRNKIYSLNRPKEHLYKIILNSREN